MLPGPTLVLACPHCAVRVLLRTLTSGNTFGSVLYSDGKNVAPMLPDSPSFHVCRGCGRPFWIREAQERKEDPDALGGRAVYAEMPTPEEHRVALSGGLASTAEEERYLRLGWWWALNDAERDLPEDEEPPQRSEEWEANLARLAGMMDPTDAEHRLFLVEIARERGRFDDAVRLMEQPFPEEIAPLAKVFRTLVERRTRRVEALTRPVRHLPVGREAPWN